MNSRRGDAHRNSSDTTQSPLNHDRHRQSDSTWSLGFYSAVSQLIQMCPARHKRGSTNLSILDCRGTLKSSKRDSLSMMMVVVPMENCRSEIEVARLVPATLGDLQYTKAIQISTSRSRAELYRALGSGGKTCRTEKLSRKRVLSEAAWPTKRRVWLPVVTVKALVVTGV